MGMKFFHLNGSEEENKVVEEILDLHLRITVLLATAKREEANAKALILSFSDILYDFTKNYTKKIGHCIKH